MKFELMRKAKQHKGLFALITSAVSFAALAVSSFADEVVNTNAYQGVVDDVAATLSNANIVSVLKYAVGIAVLMVFTWWAIRKCVGVVRKAFTRGKLRL